MRSREVEDAACSIDVKAEWPQRMLTIGWKGRFGSRMDNVGKITAREIEVDDVSIEHPNAGVLRKVRRLLPESPAVSGQYDGIDPKIEDIVGSKQAFKKPGTDKSGAAREKDRSSAKFPPQVLRITKDVLQILLRQAWHRASVSFRN
jgi:hypothetical protein